MTTTKTILTLCAALLAHAAAAQTTLPDVSVQAPKWEARHGGYLVSSNFEVDSHMSAVAYPAEPFQQGDYLSVKTSQMKDDEYFVLQECSSPDCLRAHILRVWNRNGAIGITAHQLDKVSIPHEGKFFMWMQRFPISGFVLAGYEEFSPPLVLNPIGEDEQQHADAVQAAQQRGPSKIVSSSHDGDSFVLRFEGGTSVLVQRLRVAASAAP